MIETIKPVLPEVAVELPKTSFHRFAQLLRSDESLPEAELKAVFWRMRDSVAVSLGLPPIKTSWVENARAMEVILKSDVAVIPQIELADGTSLPEESWQNFIDSIFAYENNLPSTATFETIQSKEQILNEIRKKSLALNERYGKGKGVLSFTGISEATFQKMKADEEGLPEGYFTPIEELIVKWGRGICITCNSDGGNTLFAPAGESFDVDSSLPVDKLDLAMVQDAELRELIELMQKSAELSATK